MEHRHTVKVNEASSFFVFIIAIAKYVKDRPGHPSALGKFTQHVLLMKNQINYLPVS